MSDRYEISNDDFKEIVDSCLSDDISNIQNDWTNLRNIIFPDQTMNSLKNFKDAIRLKIRKLLEDENGKSRNNLRIMTEQLFYEQVIEEKDHSLYISVLNYIYDTLIIIEDDSKTKQYNYHPIKNSKSWKEAIGLALMLHKDRDYCDAYISDNAKNQAMAIKSLIKQGFQINYKINATEPRIPDNEIVKRIEELIDTMGRMDIVNQCLMQLNTCYDHKMCRIVIARNSSYNSSNLPSFPYLYLLNLSLKNIKLNQSPLSENEKSKLWKELAKLTSDYISCYDLEHFNPFIHVDAGNLMSFVAKTTIFDTCHIPKQLSLKQAKFFLNTLFKWVETEEPDVYRCIKQFRNVFDYINSKFSNSDPKKILKLKFLELKLKFSKEILNQLSIDSSQINKDYKDPNTIGFEFKNSIYANPIITCDNKQAFVLTQGIFCYAFFEKIYSFIRSKLDARDSEYTSKKIGKELETAMLSSFQASMPGTLLYSGKKFLIPADLKNKYNLKRTESECDLIIETTKEIIIFEFKAKALTQAAALGNSWNIMKDLQKGLLKPVEQLFAINAILLGEKKVKFTDGSYLELGERRIRNVAVTLFDFGALQNPVFISNLNGLILDGINMRTTDSDNGTLKDINEINSLFSKIRNIMISLDNLCGMSFRESIMGITLLNCPLIIQMLIDSNGDIKKFINFISLIHCTTYGVQDPYFAYKNIKGFSSNHS